MQFDAEQIEDAIIYDANEGRIGSVVDVYIDDESERPEWLLLDTGFLSRGAIVPVGHLRHVEGGYAVPYVRDVVMSAPEVDHLSSELSSEDEQRLCLHYGVPCNGFGCHILQPGLPGDVTVEGSAEREGEDDLQAA
ncbi:MAG TPA: PRC-barrel domain-containing protein [Thermoleophilia bacterium]|nr:PRC-barrel domain-containing protein [Thermoleophilia bacterium]